MPGKFELYKDVGGRFRFRLTGENGERVLVSDGYAKKVLALEAIVSVLKMAPEATLIDLTVAGNSEILLTDDDSVEESPKPLAIANSQPTPRKRAPARKRVAKKSTADASDGRSRKHTSAPPSPDRKNRDSTHDKNSKKKHKKTKKDKKAKKHKAKQKKRH